MYDSVSRRPSRAARAPRPLHRTLPSPAPCRAPRPCAPPCPRPRPTPRCRGARGRGPRVVPQSRARTPARRARDAVQLPEVALDARGVDVPVHPVPPRSWSRGVGRIDEGAPDGVEPCFGRWRLMLPHTGQSFQRGRERMVPPLIRDIGMTNVSFRRKCVRVAMGAHCDGRLTTRSESRRQ